MDANLIYFLLGLACTIPMTIIANRASVRFEKWSRKRTDVSRYKEVEKLKEDLQKATKYHDNPEKMALDNVRSILMGLVFIAISGLLLVIPGIIQNITLYSGAIIPEKLLIGIQITLFVSSITLLTTFVIICLDHAKLLNRVEDYEQYKREVEARIEQLENPS